MFIALLCKVQTYMNALHTYMLQCTVYNALYTGEREGNGTETGKERDRNETGTVRDENGNEMRVDGNAKRNVRGHTP